MKFPFHHSILAVAAAVTFASLAGCGVQQVYHEQDVLGADAKAQVETSVKSRPIVQVHDGAWLMGEKIQATKPEPEIYDKQVVFNHPEGMTLPEVAMWITENIGVRAVVDASVQGANSPGGAGAAAGMAMPFSARTALPSPALGLPGAQALPSLPAAYPVSSGALAGSPLRLAMSFTDMSEVSVASASASGHATVAQAAAQASRMVAGSNFTVTNFHAVNLHDDAHPCAGPGSDVFPNLHEIRSRKPAYESRNSNARESHVLVYLFMYLRSVESLQIPYKE